MSTLEQLNSHWSDYIESPDAFALLGLAPMSDQDAKEVERAVHDFTQRRAELLTRCLQAYPAVTATWLAVSAANSYHDGTFWPRLAAELGFPGELTIHAQRQNLTAAFSKACRDLGRPRWRQQLGGFVLVEEFLFHAGFPVCHSHHLAKAMRALERDNELIDPAEPGADERLSDQLSERLGNLPIPAMLRALHGSAGPLVAKAAMEVLISGSYDRVNPHLGEALKAAFDARTVSFTGPRLHPPFLRLDEDVMGFEIVCPAQESSFVSFGRFGWEINGRAHAWPSGDDFVYRIRQEESVQIVASGLRQNSSLVRSWEMLEFRRPTNKMHVFDAASRCFRKSIPLLDRSVELTAGDYWLVFPTGWSCEEAKNDLAGPDTTVLLITVQPGSKLEVEGPGEARFAITSRMVPMILPESLDIALTSDGEKLLLGDLLQLTLWLPQGSCDWEVKLKSGDSQLAFSCVPEKVNGDWTTVVIDASRFAKQLAPALHEIEAVLLKSGQTKFRRAFLLWTGCNECHPDGSFDFQKPPRNLERAECIGFESMPDGLRIQPPISPFRTLTFKIDSTVRRFRWRNAGLFSELVRRRPGHTATAQSLAIGTTFSVSADSDSWLRVWFDGATPPTFVVNDTKEDRTLNANGHVEFSLADLSVRHPHGGKIEVELESGRTLVARFASPFRPKLLENPSTQGWRSLDFILGHGVERVRVVCVELCSGRREEFEPRSFDRSEEIIFHNPKGGLPKIKVRTGARKDPTQSIKGTSLGTSMGSLLETAFRQQPSAGSGSLNTTRLGIDLPISGWPEGLWFVGLEAARNTVDVCESLTGPDGKAAVRLIAAQPSDSSPEILRLVWHAWQQTLQNRSQAWLEWPWTHDALTRAVNVVEAIRVMFPHGFTELLAPDFAWVLLLERAVAGAAEDLLKAGDESAPGILLDLARSHPGRLRLLRVPEVLAFPAHVYTALQHREPAFVALRQCAEMGVSARLSQHVTECPDKFAVEFLRGFRNFASIKQYAANEELSAFDVRKYWQTLIQAPTSAGDFAPVDGRDLLGVSHWQWAWREFRRRYAERQGIEELGYANKCASQAASLLAFVRSKVDGTSLIPKTIWAAPWPDIETNVNFEENLPHLCSAVALAARVAGERRIAFADALTALRGNLTPQSFNAGLRALLELTPELLGFFLLFWQSILNTSPHHD